MGVKFTKNHFPIATKVTWEDIFDRVQNDYQNDEGFRKLASLRMLPPNDDDLMLRIIGNRKPPTFISRSSYTPGSLKKVQDKVNYSELHIYISFVSNSDNFGRHNDNDDVLLVQSIGKMKYEVEGISYILNPGDSLFIPEQVYHTPIVLGPRVTLSFAHSCN